MFQVDVPTIELVDLPGIQLFPDDLYKQTTGLVKSYLCAKDTLVLCVVDATIPALDSSVALKMVQDAEKLPQTILALTKADLIQDEESIVEHIFERVLGRSSGDQRPLRTSRLRSNCQPTPPGQAQLA